MSLSWFQTVGQPDLLPFPLNRWLPWQCPLFPGPVVSSTSSFTFFFCFPSSSVPHPPPSQMLGSLLKRSKSKVSKTPSQDRVGGCGGLWGG